MSNFHRGGKKADRAMKPLATITMLILSLIRECTQSRRRRGRGRPFPIPASPNLPQTRSRVIDFRETRRTGSWLTGLDHFIIKRDDRRDSL